MTKDQLIEFARRAGFVVDEKARQHQPNCIFHTHHMVDELLTRFAELVAAAEREACAKVCDELAALNRSSPTDSMWQWGECAAAIRARN